MSPRDVAPLVLAAGAGTRMGRPKASLPFGDTTALGLILDACAAAGLAPAVVVSGAAPEAVRDAERRGRVVHNPRWAEGRTTSLQAGLRALPAEAAAFLLWPVDVCLPGAAVVRALLAARDAAPGRLAWVPSRDHRRGHPALFARGVAARFLVLGPDDPARDVVRALAAEGALEHVPVDDPFVLRDMDTPADHAAFVAEWRARRGASPSP
ncbi:MAG: NTP transferase domain-containing protein [Planctomycetes bacterium]|nr:NTP transferase domain-containing protein [Planctomycetota bacterium]